MNAYLNYIIEANVGLILFLIAYFLILRKETDFKSARILLLIGVLTSIAFPLFHVQYGGNSIPSFSEVIPAYVANIPAIDAQTDSPTSPGKTQNIWFYLQVLYLFGFSFFSIRFLVQLVSLLRTIVTAKAIDVGNFKLIALSNSHPPFSFFNFIFIGKIDSLSEADKEKILSHESVHAKQLHSFDILLLNLLSVFFWFNPFIKSYKNIFVQLHEFEADACAVEERDVDEYCSLLAKVALQSADFKLANHFSNSLTLKRIEMMRTLKHNIGAWKIVMIAAFIPLSFFIIACQDQVLGGEQVYLQVDETAVAEGGMGVFYEHVGRKVKYPAEARQNGIEGKVFVEFIINKDGSIEVTGTSGIGGGCDLTAIQAVKSGPKWIPGKIEGTPVRQRMVLPISFMINTMKIFDIKSPEGSISEVTVVGYTSD